MHWQYCESVWEMLTGEMKIDEKSCTCKGFVCVLSRQWMWKQDNVCTIIYNLFVLRYWLEFSYDCGTWDDGIYMEKYAITIIFVFSLWWKLNNLLGS